MTTDNDQSLWTTFKQLASLSSQLFIKKLSRNDTSWADYTSKHQGGFYIPREIRESDFFPRMTADNPAKAHIFHAECRTLWPQTGEVKNSNMRHYSNKGPETHFTGVPHNLFSSLTPASLLLSGKFIDPEDGILHWFIIFDSTSEAAELLETAIDLKADFHFALFAPESINATIRLEEEQTQQLIEQLDSAIRNGRLDNFIESVLTLPSPVVIANEAKAEYLRIYNLTDLNPYSLEKPGDTIMQISRDIEYSIYKRYEVRRRAAEVIKILSTEGRSLTEIVVRGFSAIDAIFLSASQQRKTRAGRSFENHITSLLRDGRIHFEEQAVTGGRRPDFVLPDVRTFETKGRQHNDAVILSAKTTLRERWKQVRREGFNCDVFLATVDDRVPETSIQEMAQDGITLIVPESLKASKETCYGGNNSVISFKEFFDVEIHQKRPALIIT